ncbi:MAG: peptide-methionine (S)-S-oxide reductase MsrA [Alphaproteobacteria bacterium]|nr:peptide-methionine (S)-S-oxide reductase MsrA [Alphaproteobacteria bacterium]
MLKNAAGFIALATLAAGICIAARAHAETPKITQKTESITLAGGCFWGVEAVFEHTKGVVDATSGYTGGKAETATYDQVSSGTTGHAEAMQVTYDPKQITLDTLLDVYFTVAHNPTQLNYQGPDHGTQYRSAVFYNTPEQKKAVEAKIETLKSSEPVVTKLEPLDTFYAAEGYHQNYLAQHPYQPYIVINDAPKIAALEKQFPDLYRK